MGVFNVMLEQMLVWNVKVSLSIMVRVNRVLMDSIGLFRMENRNVWNVIQHVCNVQDQARQIVLNASQILNFRLLTSIEDA